MSTSGDRSYLRYEPSKPPRNLWKRFDEVSHLPPHQAQAVIEQVWCEDLRWWQREGPVAMVLVQAVAMGLVGAGLFPVLPSMWIPYVHLDARLLIIAAAVTGVAILIERHVGDPAIRRHLLRRLPHLCNQCGYDLTGNASGVCPECGHVVETAGKELE